MKDYVRFAIRFVGTDTLYEDCEYYLAMRYQRGTDEESKGYFRRSLEEKKKVAIAVTYPTLNELVEFLKDKELVLRDATNQGAFNTSIGKDERNKREQAENAKQQAVNILKEGILTYTNPKGDGFQAWQASEVGSAARERDSAAPERSRRRGFKSYCPPFFQFPKIIHFLISWWKNVQRYASELDFLVKNSIFEEKKGQVRR